MDNSPRMITKTRTIKYFCYLEKGHKGECGKESSFMHCARMRARYNHCLKVVREETEEYQITEEEDERRRNSPGIPVFREKAPLFEMGPVTPKPMEPPRSRILEM